MNESFVYQRLKVLPFVTLHHGADIQTPFAVERRLLTRAAAGEGPFLYIWQAHHAVVLGQRDLALPTASAARAELERLGYAVPVRASGGALVPLDTGVVNVSLIIPNERHTLNVEQDFQWMVRMLCEALQTAVGAQTITVGEIAGAYCPGRYDLSINGQKFCGISQRRPAGATLVQAFVNVTADGGARARLAQSFYALAGAPERLIDAEKIGSLAQLSEVSSVQTFIAIFARQLERMFHQVVREEEIPCSHYHARIFG